MERAVSEYEVRGVDVGPETRCAHYDGDRDIIALRLGCCEAFYLDTARESRRSRRA